MTIELIGIKEFRTNLNKLWRRARKHDIHYIVTRHGEPVFYVKPIPKGTSLKSLLMQSDEDVCVTEMSTGVKSKKKK